MVCKPVYIRPSPDISTQNIAQHQQQQLLSRSPLHNNSAELPVNFFDSKPRIPISWKSEKERIEESIQKNSLIFSSEPINKAVRDYNFRERNIKKEIQPQMHFDLEKYKKVNLPQIDEKNAENEVAKEGKKEHKLYFKAAVDVSLQSCCLKRANSVKRLDTNYERMSLLKLNAMTVSRNASTKKLCKPYSSLNFIEFTNPLLRETVDTKLSTEVKEYLRKTTNIKRSLSRKKTTFTEIPQFEGIPKRGIDVQYLAKHVLVMCNAHSLKSEKNNKILKKGEGRLMTSSENNSILFCKRTNSNF